MPGAGAVAGAARVRKEPEPEPEPPKQGGSATLVLTTELLLRRPVRAVWRVYPDPAHPHRGQQLCPVLQEQVRDTDWFKHIGLQEWPPQYSLMN